MANDRSTTGKSVRCGRKAAARGGRVSLRDFLLRRKPEVEEPKEHNGFCTLCADPSPHDLVCALCRLGIEWERR